MSLLSRRAALATIGGAMAFGIARQANAAPVNKIVDAKGFKQGHDWSCWAAAAVILFRWKDGINYSEADIAAMAGPNFSAALTADTGLSGTQIADFASALGLKAEVPQNYTPKGYETLLASHGPLWVASDLAAPGSFRRHVRVLRGVSGDGTFDGTSAWVLDPADGSDSQITLSAFATQMEKVAKDELDAGGSLFPQVIRFS
jgi:hypothetical protein